MIEQIFDFYSTKVALYDAVGNTALSYKDIKDEIDNLRHNFTRRHKSLIFCFCKNNINSVLCYITALVTGNTIALLHASLAAEFKTKLISLYDPDVIFECECDSPVEVSSQLYTDGELKMGIGSPLRMVVRRSEQELPIHPNLALLLPTSGTTGNAKFVRLSYANLKANADSIVKALSIKESEIAITSLPIHYSYGLSIINSHLLAKASVVICEPDILTDSFWGTLRDYHCTSFAGVPYSYQILDKLEINRLSVPQLKKFTQAGGKLNSDSVKKFAKVISERDGELYVMYGQTEATARMTVMPSEKLKEKIGSVGVVIPGGNLQISYQNNLTQAANCEGEIVYSGPNVMMGYADSRDDLSLGDQQGGVLYTGDIGYLDEEKALYITGRLKRFSKILGYRINLDEIESMLAHLQTAAVVGKDERIYLYCENGGQAAFASAKKLLAEKLHINQGIFNFTKVEKLPLTPNGKTDYRRLQENCL